MLSEEDREAIKAAAYAGERARREGLSPESAAAWEKAAVCLKRVPRWIPSEDLEFVADCRKPRPLLERLIDDLPELEHLRFYTSRIRLSFWTTKRATKGRVLWGQASKTPTKERELLGPDGPWWDLDLSLIAWCLLDGPGQVRLLHHEALHLGVEVDAEGDVKPSVRPHDIEEFAATLGRFGPQGQLQQAAISNAARHPDSTSLLSQATGEQLRASGWLFPPENGKRWL